MDSRHWDGNLQVRLVFWLLERYPGSTPPTRTTVVVIHLLLIPPLLSRLQGVSEWRVESGGRRAADRFIGSTQGDLNEKEMRNSPHKQLGSCLTIVPSNASIEAVDMVRCLFESNFHGWNPLGCALPALTS